MNVRLSIALLAILPAVGRMAPAQDELMPERGSLNEIKPQRDHAKKLRTVLLKDAAPHYHARMICCPSFDPEWMITIVREGETEPFRGTVREMVQKN